MLMLSAMFFFLPIVTVAPPFVAAVGPVAALAVPAMSFQPGDEAPAIDAPAVEATEAD